MAQRKKSALCTIVGWYYIATSFTAILIAALGILSYFQRFLTPEAAEAMTKSMGAPILGGAVTALSEANVLFFIVSLIILIFALATFVAAIAFLHRALWSRIVLVISSWVYFALAAIESLLLLVVTAYAFYIFMGFNVLIVLIPMLLALTVLHALFNAFLAVTLAGEETRMLLRGDAPPSLEDAGEENVEQAILNEFNKSINEEKDDGTV